MPEILSMPEPHIYRAYGLYLLKTRHRFIRKMQSLLESTAHGNRVWGASFVLMDYLQENPPPANSRLMDLGCGWGLAGVYCAKSYGCEVTCVDTDPSVFPYVKVFATLNQVSVDTLRQRFDRLTAARLGEEKTIVGADICFWSELFKPLKNLIDRSLRSGVERVVIADPGRRPFYELAEYCSVRWHTEMTEWYALEPYRVLGDVLDIRLR